MPVEFGLLVTPKDVSANNPAFTQKQPLTSNIPPATITKDESLAAIFSFEFEETVATSLFSGAAFEAKPITTMYTDTKVERQSIKLILDSGSTGTASVRIIIANGVTKTSIGEIDDFSFEVHNIVTSIKVLELQLTYQSQHIHVPAMCGHFKTPPREKLLIELEEKKEKPTWKAYQTNNDKSKLTSSWDWEDNKEEKEKEKEKEEENTQANNTYIPYTYGQQQPSTYCRPKLICIDCGKKLSSMGTCCSDDKKYQTATKFYCCTCHIKHFERPK
ncbi:hypothetical protein G9A89_008123 [Geosiphon pyriformis]|nr:hypothetical protein G9A89_008123 [Geosiphon pyriformis]